MKKWFYFFGLMLVPCLAFAASSDFQADIMDKLNFPSYSSTAKPSGYAVSLNYILPAETCLKCVVSFFEEKLPKEGWELKKTQGYDESLMDSFMKLRDQLIEAKKQNKGVLPPGVDAQTAEYVISTDPAAIQQKIMQASPLIVTAEKPKDGIRCQLYIKPNLVDNNIELVINLSQLK